MKHTITLSELANFIIAHGGLSVPIDISLDNYMCVFDIFWKDPEYEKMGVQYDITQGLYNIEVKHLL